MAGSSLKPDLQLILSVWEDGKEPNGLRANPPGFESLVIKLQGISSQGSNPYDSHAPQYLLFEAFRPENRGNDVLYREAVTRLLFYALTIKKRSHI